MRLNHVPLTHPEERRLQKRLIKHKNWIFTFMAYPDVPPDNNSSERAIKAAKVKDKVSGGFRSAQGASRFAQLLSLTQTLRKQKLAILPTLTAIFQGNRGGCFPSIWFWIGPPFSFILSSLCILSPGPHLPMLFLTAPLSSHKKAMAIFSQNQL